MPDRSRAHLPLDFAPHLDALAAGQQPDGGWTFSFPQWNALTTLEWRAFSTISALKTLRAYRRL